MDGSYILHNKPTAFQRVDFLIKLGRYIAVILSLGALIIVLLLVLIKEYEAAATVFVFSLGISSYIYTTLLNQHVQVTQYAQNTLYSLQSRWDELRSDDELLEALSSSETNELSPTVKLKLRLYLESFLDIQALIIHYIRRGYFRHTEEFAKVYEEMVREIFEFPFFISIWLDDGDWGPGGVRYHFGSDLVYVVDLIVKDILQERHLESSQANRQL